MYLLTASRYHLTQEGVLSSKVPNIVFFTNLHDGQDFFSGLIEKIESRHVRRQNVLPAFSGDVHLQRTKQIRVKYICICTEQFSFTYEAMINHKNLRLVLHVCTRNVPGLYSPGQEPPLGCTAPRCAW